MATLVKICGLSTPETLAAALRAGASHVGFVHFAKSPRHLELAEAARLRALVPPQVKAVLLLVNPSAALLAEAVQRVRPDIIQFHGAEPPDLIARFRAETGIAAWRALGVRSAESL
ncbi:MAG: phosphoribosylanthranilate isomerase, partial [Erythrobacter cryptus]